MTNEGRDDARSYEVSRHVVTQPLLWAIVAILFATILYLR